MKFEDKSPETKLATFEVDESINFTEHGVAITALGLLTLKWADDDSKRLPPARLGVGIAALAQKGQEGDDKDQSVTSPKPLVRELTQSEAQLLYESLDELIGSAPKTIVSLSISQSPHASSGRAVEVDMAKKMQKDLQGAFVLQVNKSATPSVGFR